MTFNLGKYYNKKWRLTIINFFGLSDKLIDDVTSWRCSARQSKQALSALTLYNVEVYFIPFWIPFASILRSEGRANPERRQSEGKVEATVCYNYTQKNKNQGATFEKKKVAVSGTG